MYVYVCERALVRVCVFVRTYACVCGRFCERYRGYDFACNEVCERFIDSVLIKLPWDLVFLRSVFWLAELMRGFCPTSLQPHEPAPFQKWSAKKETEYNFQVD